MHGLPDFSTFLVGGRFTKLTIPSVISAYGRQRRSNPCCPWQRIQSRRIAARRRLLSASRIFARERGCRPWIAAERCALHCAKKHPRRASVARLRAIDLCCPAIIKLGTDSLSTSGTSTEATSLSHRRACRSSVHSASSWYTVIDLARDP